MRIAFPTNNKRTLSPHIGLAKGFLIVDTDKNEEFYIQNPVLEKVKEENINLKDLPEGNRGLGTGRVIPPLLAEYGVDVLVADEFGEGMKMNLQREGINFFETDKKEITEIVDQLINKDFSDTADDLDNSYGLGRGYGQGRRFGRGFARGFNRGYGRGQGRGFGKGFGRGFGFGGRGRFGRGFED